MQMCNSTWLKNCSDGVFSCKRGIVLRKEIVTVMDCITRAPKESNLMINVAFAKR